MKQQTTQKTQLPEGWKIVRLGDVTKVTSGGTPSRTKKEYWNNGTIPWLKIKDLKSFYIKGSEEKITKEGLKNSSAKIFPKGTILFTVFATLGEVVILDMDAATNQAISGIFINDEREVDKLYLVYYLKSLKETWINQSKGVTQNNINQTILKNTLIPLPPLDTQKQIVKKLNSFFEKYNKVKEEKQKAKENYERILGSVISTLIPSGDELPEGWEMKKLNEISLITMGQSPPSKDYNLTRKGLPFYQGKAEFGEIFPSVKKWCDKPKKTAEKNDILMSVRAPVGPVNLANEKCCIGRGLVAIASNKNLDYLFLFYFLKNKEKYFLEQGQGSTFNAISKKDVENIKIPLPPLSVQHQIITKLEAIKQKYSKICEEQKLLDSYLEQLPKAVLSKVFKGEL